MTSPRRDPRGPEALLDMARRDGVQAAEGRVLASMAHQVAERGDIETAVTRTMELLRVGQRHGAWSILLIAIAALARSAGDLRDWPVAARFSGMIASDPPMVLAVSMAERRARFLAALDQARAAAGAETWDAHAAAGARLSPVAVIHEALACAETRARTGSPAEVAGALGMSPKTVMHHSVSIYRKLGECGRSEATTWAFQSGLMERGGIG